MKYRLADDAMDYSLCKELITDEGFGEAENIVFPTVMALDDDGEVVGVLGTNDRDDMVLAGPLVLRHDKRRVFTALQLISLYETTMRGLGITHIVFHATKDSFLERGIERYFPQMEPYAQEGEDMFFVWPLSRQAAEVANGRQN